MSTESVGTRASPPDQAVRDRIVRDLETNILVEAGAGSGKTTALVHRMVALVRSGTKVDAIAAVTFTRKAAADLKARFRDELEKEIRQGVEDPEVRERLLEGVRDAERGFIGTIHAFCARLLRERPLEAGIDPAFVELMEADHESAMSEFWRAHLDRLTATGDPLLEEVLAAGLRPPELVRAFRQLIENPDVRFPAAPVARPTAEETEAARAALERWLEQALELLPADKPSKGWDTLQRKVRDLRYSRANDDWDRIEGLFRAFGLIARGSIRTTQNRWGASSAVKSRAKALAADLTQLREELGLGDLFDRWMAHRYQPVMAFAGTAAAAFAEERRRAGVVSFQDLLSITAGLLRRDARVRKDLGARYPRVLIDEFQDTDPVQAEIAFLLASDPSDDELAGVAEGDWSTARPRRGALFVVGDPKQSIYRFRRADIVLYDSVRRRFEADGAVLKLRSNFRSVHEIAGFVNEAFHDVFPADGSRYQPRRGTMLSQYDAPGAPARGVFSYTLPKGEDWHWGEDNVRDEATRLAGWIRSRIDAGERTASEFLILTWRKRWLHLYTRALDEAGIAAEVSGARVDVERGLEELVLVLRALADPGDPVRTVAVLTGLFFGLDLDQMVEHRLAGGHFDCRASSGDPGTPVAAALERLGRWWRRSQAAPADVFVGGLVDEVGVLVDAAAGDLASVRTGVLLYALDAVRRAALAGDTTLVGAIAALEAAIEWVDAETPLHPARDDAVRVMNIHKAKGLEAPVVILACPGRERDFPPEIHVDREESGVAEGLLEVYAGRPWQKTVLAHPLGWAGMAEEEEKFLTAEQDRVRYVAATRAGEELVIGTRSERTGSPWALFERHLATHARDLGDLAPAPLPGAPFLETPPDEIVARAVDSNRRRADLASVSYRLHSVSELAKRVTDGAPPPTALEAAEADRYAPRGPEWGTVVHAALAKGGDLTADELEQLCRALLIQHDRPLDAQAEPVELTTLLELVQRVQSSEIWSRAAASPKRLVEVPFQCEFDSDDPPSFVEGVVDLAFLEGGAWVIVDYKTDVGDDPGFSERVIRYRAQVELYADAWSRLTKQPVRERLLFYTAQDRVETC